MKVTARRAPGAVLLLCLLLTAPAARAACPGDCNGDGSVTVGELVTGVNIALGSQPVSACPSFDTNDNQTVEVSELIAAVNAALNGCPPIVIEPIFPADYNKTFTEVRNCRLGIEHGGVMIRTLANATAAQDYLNNKNPLRKDSIVVKEEYDLSATDCSDPSKIVSWSAMRKEQLGFDSVDGDWHWQRVAAGPSPRVLCDTKDCPGFPCITCHSQPDCVARDYMCETNPPPPRGTLQPVLQNLPAAVLSISGTSPHDVYAVGADPKDGRGPYVIHYVGTDWKRLDTGASGDLWWISVTPIEGDFYMAGAGGLILQYNPSSGTFTRQPTPDTSLLFGIWGTAAKNLWAVGGDAQSQGVLWHFDGNSWTVQNVSALLPSGEPTTTLTKVWGRSASDVFAVGAVGIILHFDGMSWSLLNSGVTSTLFTVHGNDSILAAVGGDFSPGLILEQSGSSFVEHAPSGAPQMNGIFVPPSGNAVAVGDGLTVASRDSSGWSLVLNSDLRDFHGTWVDSDDGIWAAGGDLSNLSDGILSYGGPQSVAPGPVQ